MSVPITSSLGRFFVLDLTTHASFYTEQMDAEGLGCKLLLTTSRDPCRTPDKQTVGTVAASQNMLTLQALSSSLYAGAAKGGCLGQGKAFGCPPAKSVPQNGRVHLHIVDSSMGRRGGGEIHHLKK